MEKLEVFIEKRMKQTEYLANMIPKYLETPGAFLGSKNYTMKQADEMKKEAEKCSAVLDFLKSYNKKLTNKKTKKCQENN